MTDKIEKIKINELIPFENQGSNYNDGGCCAPVRGLGWTPKQRGSL